MKIPTYRPVETAQLFVRNHIAPGDCCIDATAGNGNDTQFLCELVGSSGRVVAMDLQQAAIENTRQRLRASNVQTTVVYAHDSHAQIADYAEPGSVSCIMYNLGWLPGADHSVQTTAESTLASLQAALPLLKPGGILSLCIYSGKDTGFQEKEAVLAFAKRLEKPFTVLALEYYNRPNHPPMNLFILRQ